MAIDSELQMTRGLDWYRGVVLYTVYSYIAMLSRAGSVSFLGPALTT
jgi:hypothetical protein